MDVFEGLGYWVHSQDMTPHEYGAGQSRPRMYVMIIRRVHGVGRVPGVRDPSPSMSFCIFLQCGCRPGISGALSSGMTTPA